MAPGVNPNAVIVIDTYSPTFGERVLIKNQSNATVNGVYTVSNIGSVSYPWELTRATDDNDSIAGQVSAGDYIFISNGSVNKATSWVQTGTGSIIENEPIIGTDNIVYTQFGGAGTYSAGIGLDLTGTVFSVLLGAAIKELPTGEVGVDIYPNSSLMLTLNGTSPDYTSSAFSQLSLANIGTPGTYTSVTTDLFGRVTSGSNPTAALATTANNIVGGTGWVLVGIFSGFFFGNLPFVREHFSLVVLAIVIISLIPAVLEFINHKQSSSPQH